MKDNLTHKEQECLHLKLIKPVCHTWSRLSTDLIFFDITNRRKYQINLIHIERMSLSCHWTHLWANLWVLFTNLEKTLAESLSCQPAADTPVPVTEGARCCFQLNSFNWRWTGQGIWRGAEAERGGLPERWCIWASEGEEGLPFKNYEPLNQGLEISRFPKTAAQGIWAGEILFMV